MKPRVVGYWILATVALVVYGTMLAWTLPAITADAGGLAPFDMRPGGYSVEEAKAFLTALSANGRALYLDVQQRLDIVYPALYGATLFFAIVFLTPKRWGNWKWLLGAMALPVVAFDYLENGAVHGLLTTGPEAVTPDAVSTASRWTVLKSAATTVAMIVLIALLLGRAVPFLRTRFTRA